MLVDTRVKSVFIMIPLARKDILLFQMNDGMPFFFPLWIVQLLFCIRFFCFNLLIIFLSIKFVLFDLLNLILFMCLDLILKGNYFFELIRG